IAKSGDEAEGIKTVFLKSQLKARPGQFVMVWIPRLDEKPFAISYSNKGTASALINPTGEIGITVAAVGPFSNRLCSMKPGEKVGIRGPYGTTYRLEGKNVVMVGGGYGSASLTMLTEEALKQGTKVKFILGARSKNKLVYVGRIKKLIGSENLIITTDDGSSGMKGYVTDALKQLLQKEKVDKIFVCGPDKMMKAAADIGIAAGVKGEISGERWFKCGGMGLCGHCCVDPIGIRLCVEGPVISFETAAKITELGEYHRVKSSRKEKIGAVH
ncbi:MAG: dihydroorotate dehydrogenase electron transfer subunit, partial [Nanoarchaeota archaeon]